MCVWRCYWVCMCAWQIYAIWDCTSITVNGVTVLSTTSLKHMLYASIWSKITIRLRILCPKKHAKYSIYNPRGHWPGYWCDNYEKPIGDQFFATNELLQWILPSHDKELFLQCKIILWSWIFCNIVAKCDLGVFLITKEQTNCYIKS